VLLSLFTFFFRLGSLPLIGADEPRYARIAQEMFQDHRWVTPTLEFKPWFEKPPLYYWVTVPFYAVFGMTETAARLGPATLGLISALAVFWLGTRLWSSLAGLMGASILITSLGYVGFARGASTDMPLTACLTLALVLLAAAALEEKFAAWKAMAAYVFLGFSILAKGPVAIVLVTGILLLFWLLDERGGSFRRWHVVSGLAITAAVSLPWFWLAFRQNGFAFIATFFINHNLARYVSDIHHHTEPFYYYIPVLLGTFFPWTAALLLLMPSSITRELRNWKNWNPATLFMLCWVVFPLLFFSFSQSKLVGYILPTLPPLALLLGAAWSKAATAQTVPRLPGWTACLHLTFSFGIALAVPLVFQHSYAGAWRVGVVLSAAVLIPALPGFYLMLRRHWQAAFTATLVQGVIVILAVAQFAFPVIGEFESTREIAHQALEHDQKGEPIVTFLYFDHSLYYYTGYRIAGDFTDLEALRDFAAGHRSVLVVVRAEHVAAIARINDIHVRTLSSQGKLRLLELGR
jgi:4-amino-4-deoxy-L-arabinose transferase-like glycosyltransferase